MAHPQFSHNSVAPADKESAVKVKIIVFKDMLTELSINNL